MKKILALSFLLSFVVQTFAASGITPAPNANKVFVSIGNKGERISLADLSKIDVKSFETRSGRHLNFFDRVGFKLAQRDLRNSIRPDGTLHNKKLQRFMGDGDHSTGFHLGGFALGFLVGLIGVLIAYLINDDYKRNRVKWAWIGFGLYVVLSIVLIAVVVSQMAVI